MRPGIVATIRVNPKDCMAVLDVMDAAGLSTVGMSFPQMVSLALSSLLQTAKDAGQIPERDGFEYMQMLAPFVGQSRSKRKLDIASAIHTAGSSIRVPALEQRMAEPTPPAAVEEISTELRVARRDLTALIQKKDMADEGVAGITWGTSDQNEYDRLVSVVYPNG